MIKELEKLLLRREALATLDRLREEYDRSAALSIAAAAFSKRAAGHAAALSHAAVKDPRYAVAAVKLKIVFFILFPCK